MPKHLMSSWPPDFPVPVTWAGLSVLLPAARGQASWTSARPSSTVSCPRLSFSFSANQYFNSPRVGITALDPSSQNISLESIHSESPSKRSRSQGIQADDEERRPILE